MSAVLAFIGTFLLSLFVAALAALQLADYFGTTEDFVMVLIALAVFVTAGMVVLTIAGSTVRRAWLLNWTAVLLVALACVPFALPVLMQRADWAPPFVLAAGVKGIAVTLEFLVPALLAILVQWGLIRRRWLRRRGEDDLTAWPWFTTLVAGLAILNPIALDVLGQALSDRGGSWPRETVRTLALGGAGALIAMTLIEYYIRGWIRRRRHVQSPPPAEIVAVG